jgi:hypothetical protein
MQRVLLASVSLALLVSCKPEFGSDGTLTIDGKIFRPQTCHVLTGAAGGIELEDSVHARLTVVAPPRELEAKEQVSAVSSPRWLSGGETKDLGECGNLVMRGEGYHADGKRAVSGTLSLTCATATGELTYRNCF